MFILYKMETSSVIAIILGVLLVLAIIGIILILILGRKNIKGDIQTLLQYLLNNIGTLGKSVIGPGTGTGTGTGNDIAKDIENLLTKEIPCITDAITSNLNTEEQIALIVLLATTIIYLEQYKGKQGKKLILTPQSQKVKTIVSRYGVTGKTGINILTKIINCLDVNSFPAGIGPEELKQKILNIFN